MPPLPAIRSPALARWVGSIARTDRGTLLGWVERIEALAPDVEPGGQYPLEWVVFRIAGAAASSAGASAGEPRLLAGHELLADLSPMAERLCELCQLGEHELGEGEFVSPAELCARWRCSASTFKRLRPRGLVCRRVRQRSGPPALRVRTSVAEWFEGAHAQALARAHEHTRPDPALHERLVKRALRYRRSLGWTLHRCAARLARRFDRSVEGVRVALLRDPRTRQAFPTKRPITTRTRAAMLRLTRMGASPQELAQLLGRGAGATRRELLLARAAQLRALMGEVAPAREGAELDDAGVTRALAPAGVRANLRTPWGDDLRTLLDDWRARTALTNVRERELAAALHALRVRAARGVESLHRHHPQAGMLDRVETDLRWATLLQRQLVHGQHRLIVETIEVRAEGKLEQLSVPRVIQLLRLGVEATAQCALRFDALQAGRLAGMAALAIDRAVTRELRNWLPTHGGASRRASVVIPSGVGVPDLAQRLNPWQACTDPPARVASAVRAGGLEEQLARALILRFALAGEAPCTLAELAERLGLDVIRVAQLEARALGVAVRGEARG